MTDNESTGAEAMGSYSLDDETQTQGEFLLDEPGVEDPLDTGYSPPERTRGVTAHGTTVSEQQEGEDIDERLHQEEPDPNTAYGDPDDADYSGGTDDAGLQWEDSETGYREEDEFVDSDQVGDARSGRLLAPDEGTSEDADSDVVASDVGVDGAPASAEEAAVHLVDDEQ